MRNISHYIGYYIGYYIGCYIGLEFGCGRSIARVRFRTCFVCIQKQFTSIIDHTSTTNYYLTIRLLRLTEGLKETASFSAD